MYKQVEQVEEVKGLHLTKHNAKHVVSNQEVNYLLLQ